ncbi:hypothetical protein N7493_010946 [Penicillium malachiteum]|uniref:Uncharacterized protein n=1 Tax=Penicillium malachiteum TaxID=1324776 RepID=A0AAD6MQR7_9EURO|nr:hypothetical protein N7493_010946 [Penicillium malachiteum]
MESITQITAGDQGENYHMKPHCQVAGNGLRGVGDTSKSKMKKDEKDTKITALYMPYLFWVEKPSTEKEKTQSREENIHDTQVSDSEKPGFGFEYYYVALEDTKERDADQVFSQYFNGLDKENNGENTVEETSKSKVRNGLATKLKVSKGGV